MFGRGFTQCAVLASTIGIATAGFAETIHDAVRAGNAATVKTVLQKDPAAINRPDASKNTPLLLAVSALKIDPVLVKLLLQIGADVNASDGRGQTALHLAAQRGSTEVAIELLKRKANPNAKDDQGLTPLDEAAFTSRDGMARLLKTNGAKTTAFDAAMLGWTPELVQTCKADPRVIKDRQFGLEPIVLAAVSGHVESASAIENLYLEPDIFETTAAADLVRMVSLLKANPKLANAADSVACLRPGKTVAPG
jgi:ankyrin repeat protein